MELKSIEHYFQATVLPFPCLPSVDDEWNLDLTYMKLLSHKTDGAFNPLLAKVTLHVDSFAPTPHHHVDSLALYILELLSVSHVINARWVNSFTPVRTTEIAFVLSHISTMAKLTTASHACQCRGCSAHRCKGKWCAQSSQRLGEVRREVSKIVWSSIVVKDEAGVTTEHNIGKQ